MSYILRPEPGKTLEESFSGKSYLSALTQKTECVAFVQGTNPAVPVTSAWTEGVRVTKGSTIVQAGTAIATFVKGKYPGPGNDKHAAIYVGQDDVGMQVLDQWAKQGKVLKRTIRWVVVDGTRIQNDGTKYSVIE
jgi:hypothetical protein